MPTFSAGALAGREVPLPAWRKETPAPARSPRTFTQRCSARPVRTCVPCGPTNPTSMPPHRDSVVRALVSRYEFVPFATTGPSHLQRRIDQLCQVPRIAPCAVPSTPDCANFSRTGHPPHEDPPRHTGRGHGGSPCPSRCGDTAGTQPVALGGLGLHLVARERGDPNGFRCWSEPLLWL